jgi:hypothetical protein
MRGFFPFGFPQGRNDELKTGKSKRNDKNNRNCNGNSKSNGNRSAASPFDVAQGFAPAFGREEVGLAVVSDARLKPRFT